MDYAIEEYTYEISVEEYIARFHKPNEVWNYCRAGSSDNNGDVAHYTYL